MKKLLLFALGLALFTNYSIFAQKKNLVKVNFLSPIVKTFNFQYEHVINERKSLQLGVYYTGFSSSGTSFSGFGITPEFRMYLSNTKTAPEGFYLAPFVRYQSFTLKATEDFSSTESKATLSAIRPGFIIGYQWIFSDIVSLEFFLGPSYSISSLKVTSGSESDFSTGIFDGFGLRSGLSLGIAF